MKLRTLIAVTSLVCLSTAGHGQEIEDCRKLTGATERLDCYDRLPGGAPKATQKKKSSPDDALVNEARARIRKLLRDPDSARFEGVWVAKAADGAKGVCGTVNAKNANGGYTGPQLFVYNGKAARIMIAGEGPSNSTSFDRIVLGVMLKETLQLYDKFCKKG